MLKLLVVLCILAAPSFSRAQSKANLSINVDGLLSAESSSTAVAQKASDSAGVLTSFRFYPARYVGFELNYAHSRDTQTFTTPGLKSQVHAGSHEVSAAYVLDIPLGHFSFHTFALAGAGLMQFNPITSGTSVRGAQSQNKPAILWGTGADYSLSRHIALRLQYRGLFYAAPSFKVESLRTATWQSISEPTFGVVFRF